MSLVASGTTSRLERVLVDWDDPVLLHLLPPAGTAIECLLKSAKLIPGGRSGSLHGVSFSLHRSSTELDRSSTLCEMSRSSFLNSAYRGGGSNSSLASSSADNLKLHRSFWLAMRLPYCLPVALWFWKAELLDLRRKRRTLQGIAAPCSSRRRWSPVSDWASLAPCSPSTGCYCCWRWLQYRRAGFLHASAPFPHPQAAAGRWAPAPRSWRICAKNSWSWVANRSRKRRWSRGAWSPSSYCCVAWGRLVVH